MFDRVDRASSGGDGMQLQGMSDEPDTTGTWRAVTRLGGNPSLLFCTWSGCSCPTIFKRNYELQRHMMKHYAPFFWCPALDCDRWGVKSFYRNDKLKDHVHKAHPEETIVLCIVLGCTAFFHSKTDLAAHVKEHLDTDSNLTPEMIKHLKALT